MGRGRGGGLGGGSRVRGYCCCYAALTPSGPAVPECSSSWRQLLFQTPALNVQSPCLNPRDFLISESIRLLSFEEQSKMVHVSIS